MDNEQISQFPLSTGQDEPGKHLQDSSTQPLVGVEQTNLSSPTQGVIPVKKAGRRKGQLGKRTQVFLELIMAGKSTQEAYSLAGYKGQKNAAYVLRSQLKDRIEERLLSDGISREGAKLEIQKLLQLPLNQASVTVKERIMCLKFLDKLTEKEEGRMPTITPFLVTVNDPKSVTIQEAK